MSRILLVEPNYKNKYPPLGLMKISTYHKMLHDEVHFVKGISAVFDNEVWDRIYITTLFTFDFDICVETINHYKLIVNDLSNLYVGGIMASLMPERLMKATGIERSHILIGLFTDTSKVGDCNNINVDELPLDYDMLEESSYKYPAGDNYFGYTTRGCPNHCPFCAVPILEPRFTITNNILAQIDTINQKFGPKQNLLLLDNNILNAPNLSSIVDDLCKAGYARGAKYRDPGVFNIVMMRYHNGDRAEFLNERLKNYLNKFKKRIKSKDMLDRFLDILIDSEESEDYPDFMLAHEAELRPIIEKYQSKSSKMRYLDFNQGVDARKITDETMAQLARLEIKPLRIAFDDLRLKNQYCKAVRIAHKHGIKSISNYILFNFRDRPEELYERLKVNIELNRELGIQIYSFPMKFSPIQETDRSYIGEHWTKKAVRAISAILQVTKGVVAAGTDFFYKAYGRNIEEFLEILAMPRDLIMFRKFFEDNGTTQQWVRLYKCLDSEQRERLMKITSMTRSELKEAKWPDDLKEILPFYLIKYSDQMPSTENESILQQLAWDSA